MKIILKLKHGLGGLIYRLAELLPESWEKKIALILYLVQNDWRTIGYLHPRSAQFRKITPDQIDRRFQGMDVESILCMKRFIGKTQIIFSRIGCDLIPPWYYAWAGICTDNEMRIYQQYLGGLGELRKRYRLPEGSGGLSSLHFHHGLKLLPTSVRGYLTGKVMIDAGAWIGDSTVVFLEYAPTRVIAFEPSPSNRNQFQETMARNHVAVDRVCLVGMGLASAPGELCLDEVHGSGAKVGPKGTRMVPCTSLDAYMAAQGPECGTVGFIKADLEGMGLDMLKGAEKTIKRDMPVLSLSIYHNPEEFFGIYEMLKFWNLDYTCRIESLCPPWENHELTLLAFPSAMAE